MGSAPAIRVRVGADPSRLERLAVVFADPLRLKIVCELFRREMSVSEFHALYGGGSPSRIDRHFKRLAKFGWIRLVRQETGGQRRGGRESFFRAPELAIFDLDTWALLPQTVKAEFSWRAFEQFAERVKIALAAETFDKRSDRHLTWTPLVVDEPGRERVISAVNTLFEQLFEEQADAMIRMSTSKEEPIHVTVGLGAFDSPHHRRERSGLFLPDAAGVADSASPHFLSRMAKVFSSPANLRIVQELNERPMSASEYANEVGGTVPDVYRRFTRLADLGWLEVVRTKTGGRRRGATERFYVAHAPAFTDTRDWSRVPQAVRASFSWRVFEQLAEQVRAAMDAKTFDSREDRHLTWTPLVLDQQGWRQVIAAVDSVFHSLASEQSAAELRLSESGDAPSFATVYLAAFESPPPPAEHSDPAEYF